MSNSRPPGRKPGPPRSGGPKRQNPQAARPPQVARPPAPDTPPLDQELDLSLTAMAYGGEAVGRSDAGVVFAWGGISGEQVHVQVDRQKRDLAWATVTAVAEPSPLRTVPPCPYFGPCGGCQWQHITYDGQRDFKTGLLVEQLRRAGGLPAEVVESVVQPAIGMDDPWHYRNVAHFQVDPVSRRLGYFRRNSHSVVPVEVCPISDGGINAMLPLIQALFEENAQAPGDLPPNLSELDIEAVRRGQMPVHVRERKIEGLPVWQVTIRTGALPDGTADDSDAPWAGQAITIVLHTHNGEHAAPRNRRGEEEPERPAVLVPRRALRRWALALPGAVSLVELRADGSLELIGETKAAANAAAEDAADRPTAARVSGSRRAAATAAAEDRPEAPPGVVRQRLDGGRYWVAPQAFFQVNNWGAEQILAQIRAALPAPVGLLVDAYSGVGAFAFALLAGGQARKVVAVESDWAAVESARWTAMLRGVGPEKLQIEAGRVEAVLPALDLNPDVILLDPPRAGCTPGLIRYLLAAPIPRLIYVSCDPSTFARDVKALAPAYTLTRAQPIDQFPQTYHIETVAVLERRSDAVARPKKRDDAAATK